MRLAIILSLFLVGCGKDSTTNNYNEQSATTKSNTNSNKFQFEGTYYFNNDSYLELFQSNDGDITFSDRYQFLMSINPQDDTVATHPRITDKDLEVHSNKVQFVKNVNYSSGSGFKHDTTNTAITGSKQTSFTLELSDSGIKLTIKIYNDSMNNNPSVVVATRIFESL